MILFHNVVTSLPETTAVLSKRLSRALTVIEYFVKVSPSFVRIVVGRDSIALGGQPILIVRFVDVLQ
jgi:hypothetical protein